MVSFVPGETISGKLPPHAAKLAVPPRTVRIAPAKRIVHVSPHHWQCLESPNGDYAEGLSVSLIGPILREWGYAYDLDRAKRL